MQVSVLFSKHRNGPASAGPNDFLVSRPFSSSIHAIPIRRKRGLAHGLGILQCLLGGGHPGDCVPHSDAQEILKLLLIEIPIHGTACPGCALDKAGGQRLHPGKQRGDFRIVIDGTAGQKAAQKGEQLGRLITVHPL